MRFCKLPWLLGLVCLRLCLSASTTTFRYFYDDANELFRVLDSTGTLVEYIYDPSGNITQVNRSTVPPSSLSILNITPLSGSTGQNVTIYGQNFSASAAGDLVQFGGVTATVVSASSGALVVQVPAGFSTGQVTVTVNGITANSGTLAFVPPPSITSVTPQYGTIGQTLTGVVLQGGNLSGASFSLSGGGTVTPVTTSATQATVNITFGTSPGVYVMVATTSSGVSTSQTTSGDFMIVFNTAGNNSSDMLYSVFNATGNTPYYPAGTNKTDFIFSVFNATGNTPEYPAGSNYRDFLFSVFNATGATPFYPAGSNLAWQLFSEQNATGARTASVPISVSAAGRPVSSGTELGDEPSKGRPPVKLIAGQSVEVAIHPSLLLHYLELDADRAPLGSSSTGSLSLPLTAPFGVDSFDLRAFGYTSFGTTSDSLTETVKVVADPGRIITGTVIDANGAPLPGAVVTWQAQGLTAEYYGFGEQLTAIPDFAADIVAPPSVRNRPSHTSFLGALNYPNPQQIFGSDPMGVGLGANYGSRLAGKLQVDTAGLYQFELVAHRGARLTIDGQVVAEGSTTGADAIAAIGSINLAAGVHEIVVTHFESGGAAALQLLWTVPGGVQKVLPPSAITAEAPAQWRAITGIDGRFVLQAPAALDGLVVKLVTGAGSVQVDQ